MIKNAYDKIKKILDHGHDVKVMFKKNDYEVKFIAQYCTELISDTLSCYNKDHLENIVEITPVPRLIKILKVGDMVDILENCEELEDYEDWTLWAKIYSKMKNVKIEKVVNDRFGISYQFMTDDGNCFSFPHNHISPHIDNGEDEMETIILYKGKSYAIDFKNLKITERF